MGLVLHDEGDQSLLLDDDDMLLVVVGVECSEWGDVRAECAPKRHVGQLLIGWLFGPDICGKEEVF